jgi:hypothetical protein
MYADRSFVCFGRTGKNGVYYGVKLGRPIPWYTGFPFNCVPHPQYLGCILSIWGGVAFFFNQAVVDKVGASIS